MEWVSGWKGLFGEVQSKMITGRGCMRKFRASDGGKGLFGEVLSE